MGSWCCWGGVLSVDEGDGGEMCMNERKKQGLLVLLWCFGLGVREMTVRCA